MTHQTSTYLRFVKRPNCPPFILIIFLFFFLSLFYMSSPSSPISNPKPIFFFLLFSNPDPSSTNQSLKQHLRPHLPPAPITPKSIVVGDQTTSHISPRIRNGSSSSTLPAARCPAWHATFPPELVPIRKQLEKSVYFSIHSSRQVLISASLQRRRRKPPGDGATERTGTPPI